ncbi:MAG: SDR family oxidoreductase [Synergistetes bacterium]|nr:SDR family oxidoreductase [Synergistota bacterium]MCX8127221.1 SDR family oxidoreductase [Synergistota bacterium]MDW8191893.1 SDR family NAD(P)-dependent oxidoreductase [Synergistota bacterium]
MKFDFSGKVVLVTGGGRGIGRSIALFFSASGATVIIFEILEEEGKLVVNEISEHGGKGEFYKVDVSNFDEVKRAIDEVLNKHGKIDVLVNNAGIVYTKPFVECLPSEWERVIAVNLIGVFNTCRAVFPHMIERKYGKIINIASVAGKRGGGIFGNSIYAASKGGVIAFTKALAREGGPYGVNVNAICPGPTETKMLNGFSEDRRKPFMETIPLRRFGRPEDIAHAVLFLASDYASFITGEIMDVDGGIMMD